MDLDLVTNVIFTFLGGEKMTLPSLLYNKHNIPNVLTEKKKLKDTESFPWLSTTKVSK